MNTRRRILERLKAARFDAPAVDAWKFPPAESDLTAQFSAALTASKGEVVLAKDLEAAWKSLAALLEGMQARRVVYNPDPLFMREQFESAMPGLEWVRAAGSPQRMLDLCMHADAGLTTAAFGFAETGTVGVPSGSGISRLVSLVPETHIVLLASRQLLPDLLSWESIRPKQMPSQLVLVSGPSKTADIEQTLVVGAHGPKRLVVIVYGG